MNASLRTRIIAEGIAIYARYMNTPPEQDTLERKEWLAWRADKSGQEINFVRREQYGLFDRVNASSWE